jgi:hypothetical protein
VNLKASVACEELEEEVRARFESRIFSNQNARTVQIRGCVAISVQRVSITDPIW